MATYKLKKKQENSINITLHAYKNEIEKNKTWDKIFLTFRKVKIS